MGTDGDSYADATPEQEEEEFKGHKHRGHKGDEVFLVNIMCVIAGSDLVNKEPGGEEHADDYKYHNQVWEDSWCDYS